MPNQYSRNTKILLGHLGLFLLGAPVIALSIFYKFYGLQGFGSVANIVTFPVMFVYIVGFGILCIVSCLVWLFFGYISHR